METNKEMEVDLNLKWHTDAKNGEKRLCCNKFIMATVSKSDADNTLPFKAFIEMCGVSTTMRFDDESKAKSWSESVVNHNVEELLKY